MQLEDFLVANRMAARKLWSRDGKRVKKDSTKQKEEIVSVSMLSKILSLD